MTDEVRLTITPTWDVFGGSHKWVAMVTDRASEEVLMTGEAETIDRAVTHLAINLGAALKREKDRQKREYEERRLAESR